MGNTNPTGRGPDASLTMKGHPLLFHTIHSVNIVLSADKRRAKRAESFCKGICFSARPVALNERVYIKFAEVSTSWSGVIRFGFTAVDPATLNPADLPRYACPDLTNKPGYWAKALPERFSDLGNVLFFYVTRSGDVMFGVNGEEKGVFFSGVSTNVTLWALVDIYGNTTAMEFVDGRQLNNLAAGSVPAVAGSLQHTVAPSPEHTSILAQQLQALQLAQSQAAAAHAAQGSVPTTPASASSHPPGAAAGFPPHHAASSPALLPGGPTPAVKYHSHLSFSPMPFHVTTGRHVCVSSDRTVAVRLADEYCNGYVFSHRPLLCAETLVVQVLGTDSTFSGGLTFGMTAADPISIFPAELPDDSDLLLDRGEYWVVNKDVCAQPEIGDELSFSLTNEGEVRYGRNGHHVATLMHIDKTLPMWAFFDVYGSVQKIKILGVVSSTSGLARRSPMSASRSSGSQPSPQAAPTPAAATTPGGAGGSLTVALPPPRTPGQGSPSASLSSSSTTTTSVTCDPPPRPPPPGPRPPPQQQQPPAPASLTASLTGSLSTGRSASPRSPMSSSLSAAAVTPPSLPPKQYRHSPVVTATTGGMPLSLPPPLIPTQVHSPLPAAPASPTLPPAPPPPPRTTNPFSPHFTPPSQPPPQPAAKIHPTPPSRGVDSSTGSQRSGANTPQPAGQSTPPAITPRMMETDSQEAADNASNECTVCWERPPNCVIYTCGHMCMCYECAVDIKANRGALCPICRQEIKDIIKIFKS